jgi:hypothetical protein
MVLLMLDSILAISACQSDIAIVDVLDSWFIAVSHGRKRKDRPEN